MSSQNPRTAAQQDYIARIRHSNALPPPPFPPKLLDIPNTGLSSGQYTAPGFGTRLLREQPLVIEADEFSGMDFNLIGFPGAFEGDDQQLSFPEYQVESHPKDRVLLRPLNAHGKATATPAGITFLRKTEYTSAANSVLKTQPSQRRQSNKDESRQLKERKDAPSDDHATILRHVVKGFNLAYPQDAYRGQDTEQEIRGAEPSGLERDAWERPKNPMRNDLSLVDSYPLLPDLEAIPDLGAYVMVKFNANPGDKENKYDKRLDAAMLRPLAASEEENVRFREATIAWELAPGKASKPEQLDAFELFFPEAEDSIRGIKRKLDVTDPQADDELLYDAKGESGEPCFKLKRVRKFESQNKSTAEDPYGDSVAIALHDPESFVGYVPGAKTRLQKAAYVYPIMGRFVIRAARPTTINALMSNTQIRVEEEERVDMIDFTIAPQSEDFRGMVAAKLSEWDPPS